MISPVAAEAEHADGLPSMLLQCAHVYLHGIGRECVSALMSVRACIHLSIFPPLQLSPMSNRMHSQRLDGIERVKGAWFDRVDGVDS